LAHIKVLILCHANCNILQVVKQLIARSN